MKKTIDKEKLSDIINIRDLDPYPSRREFETFLS